MTGQTYWSVSSLAIETGELILNQETTGRRSGVACSQGLRALASA